MTSDREKYLRRVDEEERKALEFLDETERYFFDVMQGAKLEIDRVKSPTQRQQAMTEFDRKEADASARFTERRERTRIHFQELREV